MKLRLNRFRGTILMLSLLLAAGALVGCQARQRPAPTPVPIAPAAKLVWSGSYAEHIQPIFDQRCVSCHGQSRAENGLRLTSYSDVMKGTQYGPVVVAGSPEASTLLAVVTGRVDPSIRMPHDGQRLSELELQNLTLWIEAGAPPS